MGQKYVCKLPGDNKNKGFAHGEMVSAMGKWIYVIPFPHGQIFLQPPDATFKVQIKVLILQPPDATFYNFNVQG